MSQKDKARIKDSLFDPQRWGLSAEAITDLAARLHRFWSQFRSCFTTRTWDTSQYAFVYLRGLLTLDTHRNYTNIARRVIDIDDDGQNLQHFMSDSPWPASAAFDAIQMEICHRQELRGGILTLDDSGDKRAGSQSAGASRQYIGRLGKVDLGQVGVALGYYQHDIWALVDAELYLPEVWFDKQYTDLRKRWHIPKERTFATKTKIGHQLIKRARANGLPFEIVSCDSWYGRDSSFRANLDADGERYIADIPADTEVYLSPPVVGVPKTPSGKRGRPFKRKRVLNPVRPLPVRALVQKIPLQSVVVRSAERGWLIYPCAACHVWTLTEDGTARQEILFIWRQPDGSFSFSLSNADAKTSLTQLAHWRSGRYFVERTIEDVKTESGWDELVARKYRAFMHHTALNALALWFVAEIKLDWSQQYPPDPRLEKQLEVNRLPALSMANVRELLKAALPLEQLSKEQAARLVVKHLVARSRSTRCRLKAQSRIQPQGNSP